LSAAPPESLGWGASPGVRDQQRDERGDAYPEGAYSHVSEQSRHPLYLSGGEGRPLIAAEYGHTAHRLGSTAGNALAAHYADDREPRADDHRQRTEDHRSREAARVRQRGRGRGGRRQSGARAGRSRGGRGGRSASGSGGARGSRGTVRRTRRGGGAGGGAGHRVVYYSAILCAPIVETTIVHSPVIEPSIVYSAVVHPPVVEASVVYPSGVHTPVVCAPIIVSPGSGGGREEGRG
jgi:hypothetical protein